jgi:hypothetical protein
MHHKVKILGTQELAIFVAQLVREGVIFESSPVEGEEELYEVTFSGGF